ncbi:hypothetical protein JTE90_008848 [Oedothorax gibbosus]|uniref:Uncharacterized protein n=1 Tax=Oedothorax gibbosus TaxID=931172 RepID=A0AAV6U0H7_9ARAC|nr:hypothetical protein JTE90_008848 [Oedothorax gibbosus]
MTSAVDKILSFADLKTYCRYKISKHLKSWQLVQERSMVLFYKLDSTSAPKITTSIKITEDLRVRVFASNHRVEERHVNLFLDNENVLSNWSQLAGLLNFFGSDPIISLNHSFDYYIAESLNNLYRCLDNFSDEDDSRGSKLGFLINQIALLGCQLYSPQTLDVAFSIYLSSSNCYKEIRSLNCLTLPTEEELVELMNKNSKNLY